MTSRRRSKRLGAFLTSASLAAMACAGVASATTEPPSTEPAGSEPAAAEGAAGDVGAVGGSGCGAPHGPYEDDGVEPAGEVRVAWNDPLLSFNSFSSRGNSVANANPSYLMGLGNGGGFTYYDADLNLVNNDNFGTCTVESLDPLTVTYRVQEGVTWSDGVQIDAADLVLQWAANSTVYNDADPIIAPDGTTAEADADGNPIVLDAAGAPVSNDPTIDADGDGELESPAYDADGDTELDEGFTYKEAAGIVFDATDESLELVTQFPVISEDGLAVTLTWDSFYVDFQTAGLSIGVPAHVVAQNALGIEDPAEAKAALLAAFEADDAAAVKPISDFWNTGFDADSLPDDPALYLSAGAYVLTSYDERAQMTFEVNPAYTWGPMPNVSTIVYRIIGDPVAAVQALENEEVDIIQPQATADILTQVTALADRGVVVDTGNDATYEHVDLVFDNGGPFDPATYDGDAATALAVRQAFLKTIPRQEIVDRLIVPLNPEASLRDSFTTVPGAPTYEAIVSANGSTDWAAVDIEGAQALLDGAGVAGPIDVRFHFAANNPRRLNEYELIRDSAAQVGFNVLDGNSENWGPELDDNSIWDAAMFGWQSTVVDIAGTNANFTTGGQNNYGHYSNETVDALYAELQTTTDPDAQQQLLLEIEQNLWADGFGVTIFQFPGVLAFNETYVSGVSDIPLSPKVFWNFWEWVVA